jgi:hypothetical protein
MARIPIRLLDEAAGARANVCPEGASDISEGLAAPAGYPGTASAMSPAGASDVSEGLAAPAGYPGTASAIGIEPKGVPPQDHGGSG